MTATLLSPVSTRTDKYAEGGDPLLFRRRRTWWLLLALFLMADGGGLFTTQGIHPDATSVISGGAGQDAPTISIQIMSGAMWAICMGLGFGHIRSTIRLMLRQRAVMFFPVFAMLSVCWSQAPWLTFRKAAMLFLYLLFTWYFAAYYRPEDQRRILLALGIVMGLGSVLWGIMLPKYGIHATGEWKGIFGQKNMLGTAMFFLFSGLPFIPIHSMRQLGKIILVALLPLGLIFLSQSRSSLFLAFLLVGVRILGPRMACMKRQSLPFLIYWAVSAIAIIPLTFVVVLPLLGRDMTLTGRTHIWAMMLPLLLRRPWLGYGYQAFFVNTLGEYGPLVFGTGTGSLYSIDNAYLDIMSQCGLIGLASVLVLPIVCARDFIALLRTPPVPLTAYWYAALLIAIYVGSIAENMIWKPIRIIPFTLALACAGLGNIRSHASSY